jgi:predicted short-subunit dehydrogenase-like oxidoreductase (DUF2520 family)
LSPIHPAAPRLNLIGAGRLGSSLAALWQAAGCFEVQDICTRSLGSAEAAAAALKGGRAVTQMRDMRAAEVWLIAVVDNQIEPVADALAELDLPPAIVWHCSGFWPASACAALQARGWHAASAHPALSFADASLARAQFPGTACALEGDAVAVERAKIEFGAIGGRCFALRAADKTLYHSAAVLASNFLPTLQAAAFELWREVGMPSDLAKALWQSFVRRGCDNLLRVGPAAALTGPAARGDTGVVEAEAAALEARDAALGQAYAALSVLAVRLAKTGHALAPRD